MADNNIPAYPYMFSPDQFTNKYSPYAGKALPWPSQYQGVPTDALGRPIQSYLDAQQAAAAQPPMAPATTLNSSPMTTAQAYNQAAAIVPQGIYGQDFGGRGGVNNQTALDRTNQLASSLYAQSLQNAKAQQAAQPTAGGGGIDMSQAYLNALSNPGHVTTPGATVAQAPTPTGQSGVLQQFLANWQNKGSPTTGAGNYNNAGFFNALQGNV